MVQIHSPRPFLLEPIIYRHTYSRGPSGLGPGGPRFKSNRYKYAISPFSHRLTLRLRDVRQHAELVQLV